MRVRREGVEYELLQFNDQWKAAPYRLRNLVCFVAHYGCNRAHVHTLVGVHYLADGDWLMRRNDGHCLVLSDHEFQQTTFELEGVEATTCTQLRGCPSCC